MHTCIPCFATAFLFFDWACFSAQQAAEKAVNAVFQKMGGEAWGRSVADLLEELGRSQPVPEALQDIALELDKVYIPTRYPDAHLSGSPRRRYIRTEAQRMVTYADHSEEEYEQVRPTIERMIEDAIPVEVD